MKVLCVCTCVAGVNQARDISFENPPYAVKNGHDEIMYDGTTGVRVSQRRLFSPYVRVK